MHQAKKNKTKKAGPREINNNFGQRKMGPQRIKKKPKMIKMFSRNWKMQEVLAAEFNQEPEERLQKEKDLRNQKPQTFHLSCVYL